MDKASEFTFTTPRLSLRPFASNDWRSLKKICEKPDVARMLAVITVPWPKEKILGWIANTHGDLQHGFRLAVCLRDGTLIGMVGMGGEPVSCGYFVAKEHWGKGYATEANRAFFAACFAHFNDLKEIHADHFVDNHASGHVLRKLGFVETGMGMGDSLARPAPEPVVTYRLMRDNFVGETMDEIVTKRLLLRMPQMSDAQAVDEALNDLEVARWLSKVPHPYSVTEASGFIGKILSGEIGKPGEVRFIFDADGLCGCVGVENGLGYWIAKRAWGRGYATEAADALLKWYFEQNPGQNVKSGHFAGNDASARVLTKLGFAYTGEIENSTCAATKTNVELHQMSLSEKEFRQNTIVNSPP